MGAYSMRVLYWAPRGLTMAFIVFLSMFALDVFRPGQSIWVTLGALFMHLIPSFLLIGFLLIAWRREWLGAVLFTVAGVLLLIVARPNWIAKLILASPVFVVAALFLWNWLKRTELRARP